MTCADFVELVSAELDGTLDSRTKRRFQDHLPTCRGCRRYLDQFRHTANALAQLHDEQLPQAVRQVVLAALRRPAKA